MIKIWRSICLGVVLALVLSLGAMFPVLAASSEDSATPPDGYEPQLTPETYGNTDALLIQDINPWDTTANVDALDDLGIDYDLINSSSLSGWDLSGYRFIMYASDQPQSYYDNLEANINKIEDFVSAGGLLIAHVCDNGWASGDWAGMDILPDGVQKIQTDEEEDLVVTCTEHPIIRGTPAGHLWVKRPWLWILRLIWLNVV